MVSGLAVDGELTGEGPRDARSTTRTDAVALVALLYLALTGRWPSPDGAPAHGMAPAPLMGGDPIAPAEISSGVPNDLDTLCTVTLGPNDDGPHSPAELVRELEPWGTITATEPTTARTGRPSRMVDTAVDGPLPEPHEAPDSDAAAHGDGADGSAAGAQTGAAAPASTAGRRSTSPRWLLGDAARRPPRSRRRPTAETSGSLQRLPVAAASRSRPDRRAGSRRPRRRPSHPCLPGAPRAVGGGTPTAPTARSTRQDVGVRALRRAAGPATRSPARSARPA